ncbi:MAG: ATPase [Methanoregulaceae archaeon]|nr:ATPase [Methanoregulaceae archaeon]
MVDVKKRDGRTEPFMQEKIVVSAVKAGIAPDDAREIAREIERNARSGVLSTDEIRAGVLARIRGISPEAESSWRAYDRVVKKKAGVHR